LNKDLSSYYVPLKDKFNDLKIVSLEQFLLCVNNKLQANLTGDLTVLDVMRIVLQLCDTIAYINQGIRSMSL
jgi:hypothetical protein